MTRAKPTPLPPYQPRSFLPFASLAFALLAAPRCLAQTSLRNLTGTVIDRHKEPLKGAVVQVQDETSNAILSYITGPDGTFAIKRLRADDDYWVWATCHGVRSKRKELSHFSSNKQPNLILTIRLRSPG